MIGPLTFPQLGMVVVATAGLAIGLAWWGLSRTKSPAAAPAAPAARTLSPEAELEKLMEEGGNNKVRITGELSVSGSSVLPSGFVMEGSLTVLEGARLDSLVEVRGNATLEANAQIVRPILVRGDLFLGPNARVPACRVEGAVHLHPGATVGTLLDCGALYVYEAPPVAEQPKEPEASAIEEPAA